MMYVLNAVLNWLRIDCLPYVWSALPALCMLSSRKRMYALLRLLGA